MKLAWAFYREYGAREQYNLVWEFEDIVTGRTPQAQCQQLARGLTRGILTRGIMVTVVHEHPVRVLDAPRSVALRDLRAHAPNISAKIWAPCELKTSTWLPRAP